MTKKEIRVFEKWMKGQGAWDNYQKEIDGSIHLYTSVHLKYAIIEAFLWTSSELGYDYWKELNKQWFHFLDTNIYPILAKVGEIVPEYEIKKNIITRDLIVDCQEINKKQQKKLFKLLAEQLGYEIEG